MENIPAMFSQETSKTLALKQSYQTPLKCSFIFLYVREKLEVEIIKSRVPRWYAERLSG